jgi:hypothetical protein
LKTFTNVSVFHKSDMFPTLHRAVSAWFKLGRSSIRQAFRFSVILNEYLRAYKALKNLNPQS